jgi:CPA1 family monovalent cation:H+ antiporter
VDAQASLQLLDEKYGNKRSRNEYLDNLFSQLEIELKFFARELERKKLKPISSTKFL